MSRLFRSGVKFCHWAGLPSVLCCFFICSCKTPPPPPPPGPVEPVHGPEYEVGKQHGTRVASREERDYQLVIYLHDSVVGDSRKEADFREGFVVGFTVVKSGEGRAAEEAVKLGMGAAASFEYGHGQEIAQKVAEGSFSDTTARTTLTAPRSLVDDLALKSGFIQGFGEGGEAMYYGLTR